MRRWIIQFLLIVLPLQFSWAAAAVACTHESAAAANHFGHHVHVHKAKADSQSKADHGGKLAADTDCPFCHLGGSTATADIGAWDMPAIAGEPPIDPLLIGHSLALPGPERPNWLIRT